jgi:hypothetical protein
MDAPPSFEGTPPGFVTTCISPDRVGRAGMDDHHDQTRVGKESYRPIPNENGNVAWEAPSLDGKCHVRT